MEEPHLRDGILWATLLGCIALFSCKATPPAPQPAAEKPGAPQRAGSLVGWPQKVGRGLDPDAQARRWRWRCESCGRCNHTTRRTVSRRAS
jgi:hypothetical protein